MRTVDGTCHHDCPDSCGWTVTVDDAGPRPVAVKLRGNPDHPFSQGELCPKVNRFLDRVYSPDRILHPLRRIGPKGSGEFERIGWGDALAEIAERLHGVIAAHGPAALLPRRTRLSGKRPRWRPRLVYNAGVAGLRLA